MQKVKFTNSIGESIDFGIKPPFILQRIDGTGSIIVDNKSSRSAYQDGSKYSKSYLQEREIELVIAILSNDERELFELRQNISRIFNPKLKQGTLEYTTNAGTKKIKAVSDITPVFSDYRGNSVIAYITLVCHDPYWYDTNDNTLEMITPFTGLFEFPLTLETEFGYQSEVITVTNSGDTVTPLVITFNGDSTNPILTNRSTGEFIKLNCHIQEGEKIIVDTSFGNKSVKLIKQDGKEENVFRYLDRESTFMQLDMGKNELFFSKEGSTLNTLINIKWSNRYLGL